MAGNNEQLYDIKAGTFIYIYTKVPIANCKLQRAKHTLVMRKRCELTVDVITVSFSVERSPYVARTRSPSVTARQLTTDSPNRAERPEMTLSSGERSPPLGR